jgi:outer membrane protein
MKTFSFLIFFVLSLNTWAQTVLDQYIKDGLKNNIVLQQKNISLEKALFDLKEANALFLPSINLNSTYVTGKGGRYFNFPLGDLMNPVYNTLNDLTESNNFPNVENQELYFNPNNYYDAHIRSSVPIVNTDIIYNKSIRKEQAKLQQYEVDVYKRELVKNIKISYYNYLSALSAVKVLESAEHLVNKNLEVNKSLLKNGKGLHASVLRTESEVEMIKVELTNARNQVVNASRYFNFLLNKPLDEPILTDDSIQNLSEISSLYAEAEVGQREELKQVLTGEKIYSYQYKLNRSYWIPRVSAFLDLGSQGADMEISDKSRYYLFGAQLDIPIFNGLQNGYKIKRSKLDLKYSTLNSKNIFQQLELSASTAKNNLTAAYQEYQGSQKQLASAKSYFKLIETGFNEGTNSLIEYLDARNQLTSSELKLTITTFKVLQAVATLERETASDAFTN